MREASLAPAEWVPPVNAMGGPPAHALYADLVARAGFRLFRGPQDRPWVILRDGTQRRAFAVPSPELQAAIDRFRIRRSIRVVSEDDFDEFVRVIAARASDPDAEIPLLPSLPNNGAGEPPLAEDSSGPGILAPPGRHDWRIAHPSAYRVPYDFALGPAVPAEAAPEIPTPEPVEAPSAASLMWGVPVDDSRSGAQSFGPSPDGSVARFVRVFRNLVREGDWLGTTRELSDYTQEDPASLFDFLLRHRPELAENGVLIANVEFEGGYRWLAVDRSRVRVTTDDSDLQ